MIVVEAYNLAGGNYKNVMLIFPEKYFGQMKRNLPFIYRDFKFDLALTSTVV